MNKQKSAKFIQMLFTAVFNFILNLLVMQNKKHLSDLCKSFRMSDFSQKFTKWASARMSGSTTENPETKSTEEETELNWHLYQ